MKTDRLCRLQQEDSGKLAQLLTECFEQDPLYCRLIPRRELRKRLLPEIFGCDLDEMFETCEVYADSPDVNGIIIVSDETEPYNPFRYHWIRFFSWLKTTACLIREDPSLETLGNFIRGSVYLNEGWTDDIPGTELPGGSNRLERRMHIVYFAVRPSMRGRGVAAKMMRSVLEYADRKAILTSLETHNEKNVRMYEHFGFRLFETVEGELPEDSHREGSGVLKQFCMIR